MKIEVICPQDGSIVLTFIKLRVPVTEAKTSKSPQRHFFFNMSGYWKLHIAE